jgi:hypothetical protein
VSNRTDNRLLSYVLIPVIGWPLGIGAFCLFFYWLGGVLGLR